jgi:hypothetical protein
MMQMQAKPHSSLKDLEEQLPLPKRSYIYAIHVDGVMRYIGKGTDGRMYAHMKEVRQRLTRKFKLKNIWPLFPAEANRGSDERCRDRGNRPRRQSYVETGLQA